MVSKGASRPQQAQNQASNLNILHIDNKVGLLNWSNFNFHKCNSLKIKNLKVKKKSCYHGAGWMPVWNDLVGTTSILKTGAD